jgi:hypothetical protein
MFQLIILMIKIIRNTGIPNRYAMQRRERESESIPAEALFGQRSSHHLQLVDF